LKHTRKSEQTVSVDLRGFECLRPWISGHPFGNGNAAFRGLNEENPGRPLEDAHAVQSLPRQRVIAVADRYEAGTGIVCKACALGGLLGPTERF